MVEWEYIECGFNTADETLNFGTRNFASIDNLYEACTLASIKCTTEGSEHKPNVKAVIKCGSIFFSIDKTMKVFSDILCSNLSFNITFDDQIDVFCVTGDGKYLLLGLQNGTTYCFEMENGVIIYTGTILESSDRNEPVFIDAFVEQESGSPSFLLVSKNGKVYRITTTNNECENQRLKFKHELLTDLGNQILSMACLNQLLTMATEQDLCLYNLQTKAIECSHITGLKKLFPRNRTFLGLKWNGHLINICAKTFLTYPVVNDTVFEDVLVITDASNSHILGVTKKNEFGISYLQLLTYPEYSTIFSLKITEEIQLVRPEHTHDEIVFISVLKNTNKFNELRFQVVSETSPENRLKRLLRRQKFDEAERFAQLFQLDLTEIQKAKAQALVDKSVCDESDIKSLLNILNTIEDDAFKIQSCLSVHSCCSNLKGAQTILSYGCSLLSNCKQTLCEETRDLILQLMIRFNTFMALEHCGGQKYTMQEWNGFSKSNIIEEVCVTLEHNCIEESIIIFTQMATASILKLTETDIHKILHILNNVPFEKQLPFFMTFLPITLSYLPSSLDLFVNWIVRKVFQTEINHPNKFPENAITFMKKMQHPLADWKNLLQLRSLLEALEQLQILKNNYKIIIPLELFLEPKEVLTETVVLNLVTDNMANEDLVEFIQKFIQNYHLEPDIILSNVIKDITTYAEECWIKVVPIILNLISSVNLKLEATLITVKAANIPWSPTIHAIANKSLQYSHPLVEEISHEVEYEPKAVIFNKYPSLANRSINSIGDLKHAMSRIIYCNRPSMIEDLYQVCINSKEKYEANRLLILHYIKTGELKKILEILNNNSQEVIKCCKYLQVYTAFTIQDKHGIKHLQENCYQILGSVFRKLEDNAEDYEKSYYREHLTRLRGVYKIREHFNLMVMPDDLEIYQNKNDVFNKLLIYAVEDFQESNNLLRFNENCNKISAYLGINKNKVLLKLCEQIGDFNAILQAAEKIYLSDAEAVSLCQVVALILKSLGSTEYPLKNFNEQSFSIKETNVDLNMFTRGLKLAGKIIIKAVLKSNTNEIWNSIELANWVQTTYCIWDNTKHSPLFSENCYKGDLISPNISTINAIRNIFQSYQQLIGPVWQPHLSREYFNYNTPNLEEVHLTDEIQSLQSTVTCLSTQGHLITAYKLLNTMQNGIMSNSDLGTDINNEFKNIIDKCAKQLLHYVFAAPQIDSNLAYCLLLSCDPQYSKDFLFESLKKNKRIAQKFRTIAHIFLRFLKHYNIEAHQDLCIKIIYLFKWWNRIKNCQISYDNFFSKSSAEVIRKLIALKHLNVDWVTEFCADFKLKTHIYYDFYLQNLLLNWKPDYVIETNIDGKKTLIVKNDQAQLEQDCMEVIEIIENNESVYDLLNRTWNSINFYHYEVFICVSNILSVLKPDADNNQTNLVLLFLKNYIRSSTPGKTEEEEWYTLYPETQRIDFLSEWRLPFTPTLFTNKIWNIIRPEISLTTYTKWFEAISILKKYLNKDDMCSYVIKNIVASGEFGQPSNKWILHARHNYLLADIDACVRHMSNLERATSAVYYLTTNIPGGADQVNAIKLCYKYAQEYQNQSLQAEDVLKAVIKVRSKYFSFSTAHILHKYRLADQRYLAMISGPVEELIESLYMDERIIKKTTVVCSNCPDINNTVNELAALYNTDAQAQKRQLLNSWLAPNAICGTDPSILMSADINNRSYLDHSDNLRRASYLCTSDDITLWQEQLLQIGNVNPTESGNLYYKANALRCFWSISDIKTIESRTGTTYDAFRKLINKLTLISSLECFGFVLNVESLDEYNKKDLLNRLVCNITNPAGVNVMALVCITYGVNETKYWSTILNAMLKLNMTPELKECVIFFKTSYYFYNQKFYVEAWQAVVNNSFNFTSNMVEEDVTSLLKDNFYMIQSCPVIYALDLEYVLKRCLQLKRYDFAALAVMYVAKEHRTVYLKEILEANQNIHKEMDELAQLGFGGISCIKNLMVELQQKDSSD